MSGLGERQRPVMGRERESVNGGKQEAKFERRVYGNQFKVLTGKSQPLPAARALRAKGRHVGAADGDFNEYGI
jgi:hypothetical protein